MTGKLGKLPATTDDRDITFRSLLTAETLSSTSTPPKNFGHGLIFGDGEGTADWEMNGNGPDDTVAPGFQGAGDCVWAAFAHITREWNKVAGRTVHITGKESIADYSSSTGYVLNVDSTDKGTDMREAMKYWRADGIRDTAGKRHRIAAYVSINAQDVNELWAACWLFGAVAIGFSFQEAQRGQFDAGTWDYVAGSPNEGGHCVPCFGRNKGRIGLASWADHLWGTESFYTNLNDETWAFVSEDELRNGVTERGMNLASLEAALGALR
jgi:hypothetical protein